MRTCVAYQGGNYRAGVGLAPVRMFGQTPGGSPPEGAAPPLGDHQHQPRSYHELDSEHIVFREESIPTTVRPNPDRRLTTVRLPFDHRPTTVRLRPITIRKPPSHCLVIISTVRQQSDHSSPTTVQSPSDNSPTTVRQQPDNRLITVRQPSEHHPQLLDRHVGYKRLGK